MDADRAQADALLQQARNNRGKPAIARAKVTEAIRAYRQIGESFELARALMFLGQIDRDAGQGDDALPHYAEAIALGRAARDPGSLAHRVRHLGDLHQEAGRLEAALPCYQEALALYRQSDGTRSLDFANAIRAFALLQDTRGDREQARELWREAKVLYSSFDLAAGVNEATERLARLA
jgi:tetratricopeptide (TPR) repeat protein